ncbi:MAG: hypothetical protein U0V56_06385 [Actinomycetota bacterium]
MRRGGGGREILATEEVLHLAGPVEGISVERGPTRFRTMPGPVAVFRLVPDGDDPADRFRAASVR